jgi:hypothetical protein
MATRLSDGDGVGLVAGVVACLGAPGEPPAGVLPAGLPPPAGVVLPVLGCDGGWAVELLPSELASAYAPPPAASTTMTATAMNRPRLPPPLDGPEPGGKGGAGWYGGAGG